MFRPHDIACPMEHPPAPLHKGEITFVLTDISFPKCIIRVPKESVELYKNNQEWKEFENIVEL